MNQETLSDNRLTSMSVREVAEHIERHLHTYNLLAGHLGVDGTEAADARISYLEELAELRRFPSDMTYAEVLKYRVDENQMKKTA